MAPNSSAKIVVGLLAVILIVSLTLTVFLPRYSCFYEMRDIDAYTISISGGICGCCFAFSLLSLILLLKWPHSTRVKYFTQLLCFIFIFGTSVFGICAIGILAAADSKMNFGSNATNDYSVFAIRAAAKFLAPERQLSSEWAQVALKVADSNSNSSAATDAQQTAICRLQKQFQCMMWEGDRDTCVFPISSSSSSSKTFKDDLQGVDTNNLAVLGVEATTSTTTTSSSSVSGVVPCLTCGIFTMNVTESNRPISCMQAMVDCFVNGRHKYATSVEDDPMDPEKYGYKADKIMLTVGTAILFVFSIGVLWKNGFRSTGVEPARYGQFEHGAEYRSMKSEMYDN